LGCQEFLRAMFIWGFNNVHWTWAYVAYGAAVSGECMLYVYRIALVQNVHNQKVTSYTSASLYLSTAFSSLFSQYWVGFGNEPDRASLVTLFLVSMGSIALAGLWAFFYFPTVNNSLKNGKVEKIVEKISKGPYLCYLCNLKKQEIDRNGLDDISGGKVDPSQSEYEKKNWCCDALTVIFKDQMGLYWGIYWIGFMVLQYSTDADMQNNWKDADPQSRWSGMADFVGIMAALIGTLMPIIIKYALIYIRGAKDAEDGQPPTNMERCLKRILCTKVPKTSTLDYVINIGVSLLCGGLCIVQSLDRRIFNLYIYHGFYQFFVAWGIAITTSYFTKA
jgi:hypothetical protein